MEMKKLPGKLHDLGRKSKVCLFSSCHDDHGKGIQQEQQGEEIGDPWYEITLPGIKGKFIIGIQLAPECIRLPVRGGLEHLAFLVDEAADAGVGGTGHAPAVFYGPQP